MIWVVAVLSILLVLLIWILFTPITICIDTLSSEYYINAKGICKVSLNTTKTPIAIDINIPMKKFSFSPLEKKKKTQKKTQNKNKTRTRSKSIKGIAKFIAALIQSFELIKLRFNVDTQDYALNAQLVPIFQFLSGKNRSFSTNFNGNTTFQLTLRNRLIRMVKPVIQVVINK